MGLLKMKFLKSVLRIGRKILATVGLDPNDYPRVTYLFFLPFIPILALMLRSWLLPTRNFGIIRFKKNMYDLFFPFNGLGNLIEILFKAPHEEVFTLEPEDTVIDIGAFVGFFTIKAAMIANKVIAIEPHPKNFDLLQKNVSHFKNVILLKKALGSFEGEVNLHVLPATPYGSSMRFNYGYGHIKVSVVPLDKIASEIGIHSPYEKLFIKVDVEGAEIDVLKGARQTIKKPGTRLVVEANHYPGEVQEVCEFLKGEGLEIIKITDRNYIHVKMFQI